MSVSISGILLSSYWEQWEGNRGLADLAFAFGCFHFGLKETAHSSLNIQGFIAEVQDALRSVPNVDNVRVDCDSDAYNRVVRLSGKVLSLRGGDRPYPYLPRGHISFDLLIPQGAQREILRGGRNTSRDPLTFTERFRVEIHYRYHFPIAVFRAIEPTSEPDPSDAIIIIRKLLEREFKRQQQSHIDFQFLGPSPLHANFYLTASPEYSETSSQTFNLDIEHRRGYDRYYFYYNASAHDSTEDAARRLLLDLFSELDLYYLIVSIENKKIHTWAEINKLSQSLTELYQRRGLKGFLTQTFKSTGLVNDTFVALADFESQAIFRDGMVRNSYRNVYSSDSGSYLREIVDREMEERTSYPTEQVRSLLQLFETRRLNALELRTVLISAISGGVFGGVVSGLLGGN